MITPSQHPSSLSTVRTPANAPYAGPERRVADRRRSASEASSTFGFDALGPYLPDRLRVVQQHFAQIASTVDESDAISSATPDVATSEFGMPDVPEAATIDATTDATIDATIDSKIDATIGTLPPVAVTLPWITSFLDEEGAEESASDIEAVAEREDEASDWSLDAAAAEVQRLAASFGVPSHDARRDGGSLVADATSDDAPLAAGEAPLPMWSDDDFVDVLPVHVASMPDERSPAHETALSAALHSAQANEAAATALESVAHRVRAGELSLSGFDAALGEAAALASTLAALLSTRS